ncbi:MFS general substrate transporter [Hysterangium stoloniferum]|nr:MFS general substrate transporter [Hysterangium stoloniferum]
MAIVESVIEPETLSAIAPNDIGRRTRRNSEHADSERFELRSVVAGETQDKSTPPNNSQGSPSPAPLPDARYIKHQKRLQYTALCFCLFLAGYNDGTTGPLLPSIQRRYQLNFTIVSLLFVCACIGCVIGGLSNVFLTDRYGFGKQWLVYSDYDLIFSDSGAIGQVIGYGMMASAPPFPVLALGYVVNGFGLSLQDAQANGFVAVLDGGSLAKMNFMHAIYGFGALSAPLIATQFARLNRWSFHYLTSLGIAIANLIFLTAVFRFKTQEEILTKNGQAPAEVSTSQKNTLRQILQNKTVHFLAFFILVYVGIEVTMGGWIVTFIIGQRGGGPSAGYVSTGFFGGLTAGRLVLHFATRIIPERHTIFIYAILCIGLELTIWRVPSLIGNAICVSFIGFFLGPMYPSVMNHTGKILPRWLLTGAIGWIAGLGVAGSAVLPFMTGALANHFGIVSLQPIIIASFAVMTLFWALVPRLERREV